MARKIKVIITTPEKKINLPRFSVKTAIRFVRFGLWSSKFFTDSDEELQAFLVNNKEIMIDFLKAVEKELRYLEPFTVLELKSESSYILVNIV